MEETWEFAALDMKVGSRNIPAPLKRKLLTESGYRCSVPTCRGTSALQFEHIEDWAKLEIQIHNFDKMIVLCATCHARVTSKEIHKDSVWIYKDNLALINGRYSLFEQRMLKSFLEAKLEFIGEDAGALSFEKRISPKFEKKGFAKDGGPRFYFDISYYDRFHFSGLVDDGLVTYEFSDLEMLTQNKTTGLERSMPFAKVTLTDKGEKFIRRLTNGERLLEFG